MAAKKRSKKQVVEWSLLSVKGLATVAGLIWAYRTYRKRQEVAEAQKRAAMVQAQPTTDQVAAGAAQNLITRVGL